MYSLGAWIWIINCYIYQDKMSIIPLYKASFVIFRIRPNWVDIGLVLKYIWSRILVCFENKNTNVVWPLMIRIQPVFNPIWLASRVLSFLCMAASNLKIRMVLIHLEIMKHITSTTTEQRTVYYKMQPNWIIIPTWTNKHEPNGQNLILTCFTRYFINQALGLFFVSHDPKSSTKMFWLNYFCW